MGRMNGKVVIVTGAGTGVGQSVMRLFATEGAKVLGVSRTLSNLEQTLALVRGDGGEGRVVAADLSDDAACQRVVKATLDAYGRIDSLVHAAGVGYTPRLSSATPTGRPNALPSSLRKPLKTSTGGPDALPAAKGTKMTL